MDVLLSKSSIVLGKNHRKTNRIFTFISNRNYKKINIYFSFSPGVLENIDESKKEILKTLKFYCDNTKENIHKYDVSSYIPIKNLITISVDHEGNYLGNAHRWDTNQKHIISCEKSSLGFEKCNHTKGLWKINMHIHEIVSEMVSVSLRVEGDE